MKLIMIGPLPPPAGGARVLFEQYRELLERQEEIDLVVLETWKPNKHLLKRVLSGLRTFTQLFFYIFTADAVCFWASDRGALLFGPPVAILSSTFHKPWILRKFGGGFDLTYSELSKFGKFILKKTLNSASLVLLETKHLVHYFKKATPKANIDWHSNSRKISHKKPPHNEVCKSFVFLGKVKPSKGVNKIIEASGMFDRGEIDVDVYGPLKEGITEEDFEDSLNVQYEGVINPNQVLETLRNYDALLLPTFYEGEGYPGVILEAYSVGIPVVATNWRAIPEIVDESSGILVEPEDSTDLYRAMSNLISDPEYYQDLCAGAWKKRKKFSLREWSNKFLDYCRQVLG